MKLEILRNRLGLSITECGQILLGIRNPKAAYQQWYNMERRGTWAASTDQYLNYLIYTLENHPEVLYAFIELQRKELGI